MVKRKKMTLAAKKQMAEKRAATIAAKEAAQLHEQAAGFAKTTDDPNTQNQVAPVAPPQTADLPPDPSLAEVPAGVHVPSLNQAEQPKAAEQYIPDYSDIESNPLWPMMQQMQAQIEQLVAANTGITPDARINQVGAMNGAVLSNGGIQGQIIKYPIETSYYADPTEKLYNDPTLRRFALRENFYIKWEVTGTVYSKNNIEYAEPQFECAIFRFMYDEEGEPNGKMYLVGRIFLHEDEVFASIAARQLGLKEGVDYTDMKTLLDEIRFLRIQKWVRESFRPIHIKGYAKKSTNMVIDGKQVEVFDTEDVIEAQKGEEQAAIIKAEVAMAKRSGL